jgi:hypothetical protein
MPLTIQAMSGVAYISSYGTYYFELAGISTQKSFQIQCGAQALSIAGATSARSSSSTASAGARCCCGRSGS